VVSSQTIRRADLICKSKVDSRTYVSRCRRQECSLLAGGDGSFLANKSGTVLQVSPAPCMSRAHGIHQHGGANRHEERQVRCVRTVHEKESTTNLRTPCLGVCKIFQCVCGRMQQQSCSSAWNCTFSLGECHSLRTESLRGGAYVMTGPLWTVKNL
jgi:hypothetical protein